MIWETFLKKKIKNLKHKITCESKYLFRMRERNHSKLENFKLIIATNTIKIQEKTIL